MNSDSLQLIIFGCYYFFVLITLLSVLAFGIYIVPRISDKISFMDKGKNTPVESGKGKGKIIL